MKLPSAECAYVVSFAATTAVCYILLHFAAAAVVTAAARWAW